MGQWSYIKSDDGKAIIDGKREDCYLLVPKPFQDKYGEYIKAECYEGYGEFGSYDVYDLVAEWNKEFIPEMVRLIKEEKWHCGEFESCESLMKFYETGDFGDELRHIGIEMACYDEDNARLPYPIKITSQPMRYDFVAPSKSDPNQGWEFDDDYEDEWESDSDEY